VLIWDLCRDDFVSVIACPVAAVKRASKAGAPPPEKWYKVSRAELYPEAEARRARLAAARGG
jgi:hypothetical protein